MKFRSHLLTCAVLFPLISTAQLGFSIKQGERSVEFPIEVVNNLIVIPVVLNGQVPLKFILDTGVRTTILTEKSYSDILNLTYARQIKVSGPGGEKIVGAYITNNVTLDMPGIHGEGHAMLVLERDYLELRNYLGADIQGILGYELFSRFVIAIDYDGRRLRISHPEDFKPKKSYQWLPLSIQDTKPYVHAGIKMVGGATVNAKLMVDTGASHGLVLDPSSHPDLAVPEKHVTSIIGRGLGGVITGQIGRIKSLNLGRYKIDNVIANFPDANTYIDTLKASDVFRNGAIGGELLCRFTTIYNFPGEKIYLKKNAAFTKKFNFNLSGLTFKAKGARLRKYEITDVRKGSQAEKIGVKTGDELLSVNGLLASELDLNSLNGYFNIKPGKKIRIEVLRGGERIVMKLVLENQI